MADLSITALYTSQVWAWAKLPCAELCATRDAKRVFDVTNAALALARKPPLKFALLHRHAMIDHLVRASEVHRVIELAAGLSRRGAAMSRELDYTEVDLPAMIAKKRELLDRSVEGRAARDRMHLVAGDATTLELAPLAIAAPTMVIAEGLAMYLARPARRALFERVRALADTTRELHFVFDLVPRGDEPPPGLAGRVLERAMKRFTGGQGFERDAASRDDVLDELRRAGFADVRAYSSREVAAAWHLPHGERATTMIVFSARARASRA
ncbi:MAG TPA: class I SAM-dependent methyltransferase [Kofleriaceae bacterium]|nr:class I SAM-dependent methyltransferase [Kofleriaceae bacterium]